jgi:Mor family transcriptional regulator
MSYKKAVNVLPVEIIELIQSYVDGEYIYIPRKEENKKNWGSNTAIKEELMSRNTKIFMDYRKGISIEVLAENYFLSIKSIQRIVLQEKRERDYSD